VQTIAGAWRDTRKEIKINGPDGVHLVVSVVLLVGAWGSRFPSFTWLGWWPVIGILADLLLLLFLVACRCYSLLPQRLTALVIVALTFMALVLAFAALFLKCDCFEKRELSVNPKTSAVTVMRTKLPDAVEARYVSFAVITTAAAEYAPTDGDGGFAVEMETVSGLLFLLVAFPILAARLGEFDKRASPPGGPEGRFAVEIMSDGKWQVTVVEKVTTPSLVVLGKKAVVVIQNGKVTAVEKPPD